MRFRKYLHKTISYLIPLVWFVNGLFCKMLNFVPRHQQIVERILQTNQSRMITLAIGISEVCMTIWIMSKYKKRINAVFQIAIVLTMNTLEFIVAPDLLLWGKMNAVFAILFVFLIYYNEFYNDTIS
jgi:DoxX-like family